MPKYLIRDTTTGDLQTVEGDLPLNLGTVLSIGEYGVSALSAETIATVSATIPAQMSAPTLVGGVEEATLTLAAAPADGGSTITSYGYEVDVAAGDFSSPVAQGTQTPANLGNPINLSPLAAGDYKARSRAINAVGNGAWSAASADATVTAAPAGTITIDTLTYTRGAAGVAPVLDGTASSTGTTTANYTIFWASRSTGTVLSKADIENGTGDALDNGSFTSATLAGLDGTIDLATSLTSGAIDAFIRDSSGTPIESAVATATGVTYDAAAPVFSSAEIGTVDDTSLIVTFDKALYGSTSASDWDVQVNGSPATESAAVISGSTVDITLGAAVANGDTVTVAYTGSGLLGVDAEIVATFTAQSVTNNVVAGGVASFAKWVPSATSAWTDSVGGTQAAIGDQVAVLEDQSGNARHVTFASGKRPTLQQDGTGEYYLNFTGAQGGSVALDLSAGPQVSIVSSFERASTAQGIIYEFSPDFNNTAGSFFCFGLPSSIVALNAKNKVGSGGYSGYNTSSLGTTAAVFSHTIDFFGTTRDTESIEIRVNGVSDKDITTGTYTDADTNAANSTLYVGARNESSLFFNGKLYFLGIYNTALSGTDLTDVETEASSNTPGVSL